jgi:hypothetical protein
MTGWAWAVLILFGTLLFAAFGDLVSEEVRGWLDLAPRAILRLAAAQLDPELQESTYHGEWLPELVYVLRGAESRPITRLIRGTTFAIGLLLAARRIARYRAVNEVRYVEQQRLRLIVRLRDGRQVKIMGPWLAPGKTVRLFHSDGNTDDLLDLVAESGYDPQGCKLIEIGPVDSSPLQPPETVITYLVGKSETRVMPNPAG